MTEYQLGDILVWIGGCVKYIVMSIDVVCDGYRVLRTSIVLYDTAQMKMTTEYDSAFLDRYFVKVGRWDFERNEEVDDEL